MHEPDFPRLDKGKHYAAGVVIEEPDGRCWMVAPTNGFGGYEATFAKGTIEDGIKPQASAIKEAYEESGLKVEIVGFIADVEKSTSVTRYYRARRVGGNPADMGWESQAVHLVPSDQVHYYINSPYDLPLLAYIEHNE
ncbi:NUDIX hydrolase [Methylomonas sp. MgM2]